MKDRLIICLAIAIAVALLVPLNTVQGQDYYAYSVQVRSDGSAVWTITQFSDSNASTTSWGSYQQKIYGLVNEASNATGRVMSVDGGSLEINSTLSSESKITEYTFVWLNFSTSQGNELVFGDVFKVSNFFGQLFGDASIQLTYPDGYTAKSVFPPPYQRQDDVNMLKWARTQDLADGNVKIVLAPSQSNGGSDLAQSSFIGLAIVGVAVPVGVVGFFAFRKRQSGNRATTEVAVPSAIESDEDKILKLLKASGGSMRQTEITERLGFSKAKTSQLLTALENSGVLARYKKGRDKIVTFKKGED
jgi:Uncharacterized membrane-associated protein/domain